MRNILAVSAIAAILFGCAQQTRVGNYSELSSTVVQADLVSDATKQLMVLYPPAKSHFTIQQPTTDAFGSGLVDRMRDKGYAVQESSKEKATVTANDGLPLGYVVDRLDDASLYRVTLLIGAQTLSRAYVVSDGAVTPAGSWSRKE